MLGPAIITLIIGAIIIMALGVVFAVKEPDKLPKLGRMSLRRTATAGNATGPVNALVINQRCIREASLPTDEYNRWYNGVYTYKNHQVIVCQEDHESKELSPWNKSYNPISTETPDCVTPQALVQFLEWKRVYKDYFHYDGDQSPKLKLSVLVAVLLGTAFFAYLMYSASSTGG